MSYSSAIAELEWNPVYAEIPDDSARALNRLCDLDLSSASRHLRHSPMLAKLTSDLEIIERRLGTVSERASDLDQAQMLGHQIRNLLCMAMMADEAREFYASFVGPLNPIAGGLLRN